MAPPPRHPIRPTKPSTLRRGHYSPTELYDSPERLRPQVGVHGETILPFYSGCSPFSNFYPARFTRDGHEFLSSEQYFMFRKAVTFNDAKAREEILRQRTPAKCKELGRKVENFDQTVWESVRYDAMIDALYAKFSQNDDLKAILLSTGRGILVEAARNDSVWGVGMDEYDRRMRNPRLWQGQNLLGNALMKVRSQLRGEDAAQQPREIDYSEPNISPTIPPPPAEPASKRQIRKYEALKATPGPIFPTFAANAADRPRPTPSDVILTVYGNEWYSGYQRYPYWWDGHKFEGLDLYIHYRKAKLFGDKEKEEYVLTRRCGFRYPKNFDAKLWANEQDKIIHDGVYALYSQNPDLKEGLLSTDDGWIAYMYGYDWGIGLPYSSTTQNCPATWKGNNRYGKALMAVREQLRAEESAALRIK